MKQLWRKLGLIYCPTGDLDWRVSHASVPIAEFVDGNIFRIYFSSRNALNESFTSSLLIDITQPQRVLEVATTPVLCPGGLGEFDDSGAMGTWLAQKGDKKFFYYIGWNLGVTVPFRNSVGLAVSRDGCSFERYARGPVLDRTMTEPHFVASCCVIPGEDKWRMWYLSCTDWAFQGGRPQHRYHIKYAESFDGVSWSRNGVVAIDYSGNTEYAISRPSVIRDKDCWRMWYSFRGAAYRIGYAESEDGLHWRRMDANCMLDVSLVGWDSEMIEYPFVFDHGGKRYMLYNGNGYGATGFGLAVLD